MQRPHTPQRDSGTQMWFSRVWWQEVSPAGWSPLWVGQPRGLVNVLTGLQSHVCVQQAPFLPSNPSRPIIQGDGIHHLTLNLYVRSPCIYKSNLSQFPWNKLLAMEVLNEQIMHILNLHSVKLSSWKGCILCKFYSCKFEIV